MHLKLLCEFSLTKSSFMTGGFSFVMVLKISEIKYSTELLWNYL